MTTVTEGASATVSAPVETARPVMSTTRFLPIFSLSSPKMTTMRKLPVYSAPMTVPMTVLEAPKSAQILPTMA